MEVGEGAPCGDWGGCFCGREEMGEYVCCDLFYARRNEKVARLSSSKAGELNGTMTHPQSLIAIAA